MMTARAPDGPRLAVAEAGRLLSEGRLAEAEVAARRAADAGLAAGHAVLGAVLRASGRGAAAVQAYDAALAREPRLPGVLANKANALNDLMRWEEAATCAERAVKADPRDVAAWNACGVALAELERHADAITAFRSALRLRPGFGPALVNLARTQSRAGDAPAALAAYEALVAARPGSAAAHVGRAAALDALGRTEAAAAAYDQAFALSPAEPYLAGHRLHVRMRLCAWDGYDEALADLAARIDQGARAALPFPVAGLPLGPARELKASQTFVADSFRVAPRPKGAAPGSKIRLGYFSADLHEHATAYLLAEVLERHDRDAFDVTAFSYGRPDDSPMRRRLERAVDRFIDVRNDGVEAIRDLARTRRLDIAVDLKGHTGNARPALFAAGLAPVQVNYLGLPMTIGGPLADYIVADPVLIRPEDVGLYAEKVAWLPRCYQPNDTLRASALPDTRRDAHGLPTDALVLGSFNAAYKITPDRFRLWLRLLAATPHAVLWLLEDHPACGENLRKTATGAGVAPERLIFAPRVSQPEHLARLRHVDLVLDTFPYTAHTTASDALLAGAPLLTMPGDTFASRVAASLLHHLGLHELIADSEAAYFDLALELAHSPGKLRDVRARLAQAREASGVFDMAAYTRDLEALFRRMHDRRLAGAAPDHLAPVAAANGPG